MEIILKTEQDRDRLTMDLIIPDYLTDEEKQALRQSGGRHILSVFVRNRKVASEKQRWPVLVGYSREE